MTKREFYEDYTDWDDLIDFCDSFGCSVCNNVISTTDYYDSVDRDIREAVGDMEWWEIRDCLNELPNEDCDYYYRADAFDYTELTDDDFMEFKERIDEWGDDYNVWDDDAEEPGAPIKSAEKTLSVTGGCDDSDLVCLDDIAVILSEFISPASSSK